MLGLLAVLEQLGDARGFWFYAADNIILIEL